jgi:hypothetical protein
MLLHIFYLPRKLAVDPCIVGIKERDIFATSQLDSDIARIPRPLALLQVYNLKHRDIPFKRFENLARTIRRGIIDDNYLQRTAFLPDRALNSAGHGAFRIMTRNYYGSQH